MSNLILKEEDLGVEMWEIYSSSILTPNMVPNFAMIYDSYKIEFLIKETTITSEAIDLSLQALNSGSLDLGFLDVEMQEPKSEFDVFNYLLNQGLSFQSKRQLFNFPFKEVW